MNYNTIINDLVDKAKKLGFEFEFDDVKFDTSRAYGLYIEGDTIGINVGKFGAYRNYLGGGLRGASCNSSQWFFDGKLQELAFLFHKALEDIESLEEYDDFAEHVEDLK